MRGVLGRSNGFCPLRPQGPAALTTAPAPEGPSASRSAAPPGNPLLDTQPSTPLPALHRPECLPSDGPPPGLPQPPATWEPAAGNPSRAYGTVKAAAPHGRSRRRPSPQHSHSHMCGKQRANFDAADDNAAGPPPRAWGAPAHRLDQRVQDRTIPTCVGSTPAPVWGRGAPADHPHVRGEHALGEVPVDDLGGPSPRAWGARGPDAALPRHGRTIPTCVGSTRTRTSRARPEPDHPHVRGEHWGRPQRGGPQTGPSPRAWGAHAPGLLADPRTRTIPTCVGSTRTPPTSHHRSVGPSPRAWGAPAWGSMVITGSRTIPTCVGSTSSYATQVSCCPDHPHVRGEHAHEHC